MTGPRGSDQRKLVDPHIASHVIGEVRFVWMAAPARVRAGSVLKAEELSRHPVITMTEGSGLTRAFEAWAAEQGLRMQRFAASNSLMAIIGLTMADVGLSFLPQDFMRPGPKAARWSRCAATRLCRPCVTASSIAKTTVAR